LTLIFLLSTKQEDSYYDEAGDDDDDDDDELDDDEDTVRIDRLKRYRRAYEVALAFDTQGYQVVSDTSSTQQNSLDEKLSSSLRSARELTAISWAAHCTDLVLDLESITYRIQALDSSNLFDRLNIGFQMLRRKKDTVQKKLQKAGLQYKRDDDSRKEGTDDSDDQDSSKGKK
jgi:hypothetical protein